MGASYPNKNRIKPDFLGEITKIVKNKFGISNFCCTFVLRNNKNKAIWKSYHKGSMNRSITE